VFNHPANAVSPIKSISEVGIYTKLETVTYTFCPSLPNFYRGVKNLASISNYSRLWHALFLKLSNVSVK